MIQNLLSTLHNELRDRGFAPLEAAELVAYGLVGEVDPRLYDTSLDQLRSLAERSNDRGSLLTLLYQEFLVAEARSGLGQYLTPIPVADLIAKVLADLVPPEPLILDPFCGAGILLDRFSLLRPDSKLVGLEINEGVGSMTRALTQVTDRKVDLHLVDSFECWTRGDLPKVDAVVTNPPFGSVASCIDFNNHPVYLPVSLQSMKKVPAELLGLEVSLDALVEGGWIGAVLPQSVLTNNRWGQYRNHLFSKLELTGVVSLPEETFAPFRGVAKACVLFGQKCTSSTVRSLHVPFFRSRSIGYDETGRTSELESDILVAAAHMRGETTTECLLELDKTGSVRFPYSSPTEYVSSIKLGEIAEVFSGRTPARDDYVDGGPFLLKVGNLRGSFVSWSERKRSYISEKMFLKNLKLHLRPGDICLTAAAHRPKYIGQKVDLIYDVPDSGAMPSAEIMVIRLRADAPFEPEELLFYFRSSVGYQQIQDLVRGSTAHLYPADVVELLIPLVPSPKTAEAVTLFRRAAELHCLAVQAERAALKTAGLIIDAD